MQTDTEDLTIHPVDETLADIRRTLAAIRQCDATIVDLRARLAALQDD